MLKKQTKKKTIIMLILKSANNFSECFLPLFENYILLIDS